jgi:hypothetical protein
MPADIVELTLEAWYAEGTRLFGTDRMKWRFVCPVCLHVQSVEDYRNAGATEGMVAFSCVGRATGAGSFDAKRGGPCNYAGGGLFKLNPVTLKLPDGEQITVFEFDRSGDPGGGS